MTNVCCQWAYILCSWMFQRYKNGILNYSETSSSIERAMTSNYFERNDCMPFFKRASEIQRRGTENYFMEVEILALN